MSRRPPKTFRERGKRAVLDMANMIRRVALDITAGGLWSFRGYELDDLDSSATTVEGVDDDPVPVFQGIHIYARPAATDNAEAIMLHIGGEAEHPVFANVRSEDARARYVTKFEDLSPGEIVVFNSAGDARVLIRTNGEIEITPATGQKLLVKTKSGTTDQLVTKGEFQRHTHVTAGTGAPVGPTPLSPGGALKYTLTIEAELEP